VITYHKRLNPFRVTRGPGTQTIDSSVFSTFFGPSQVPPSKEKFKMFYNLISHVSVTELPNQIQYFSLLKSLKR